MEIAFTAGFAMLLFRMIRGAYREERLDLHRDQIRWERTWKH